jgi:hypothetical protein
MQGSPPTLYNEPSSTSQRSHSIIFLHHLTLSSHTLNSSRHLVPLYHHLTPLPHTNAHPRGYLCHSIEIAIMSQTPSPVRVDRKRGPTVLEPDSDSSLTCLEDTGEAVSDRMFFGYISLLTICSHTILRSHRPESAEGSNKTANRLQQ